MRSSTVDSKERRGAAHPGVAAAGRGQRRRSVRRRRRRRRRDPRARRPRRAHPRPRRRRAPRRARRGPVRACSSRLRDRRGRRGRRAGGPGHRRAEQPRPAPGAAGRRRRRHVRRPAPRRAPPWPAHVRGRLSVATSLGALCDDAGLRALVEGLVLGSFEFHWRSDGPGEQPVGRVVLAGLVGADDPRRDASPRRWPWPAPAGCPARSRWCPPTSRTRPGWPSRPRDVARRGRAADQGVGREAARQRGLRRHRRGRPGLGQPAAAGPARLHARSAAAARPRTSCWSARASPSTPAACRSSRATT